MLISRIRSKVKRILTADAGQAHANTSDEYIEWVCFAIGGMLERGNLACFDHAIKNLPSGSPIIEIGSFCGLSTNLLTYFKRRHGRTSSLITCDRWQFEGSEKETAPGGAAAYRTFVKESFERNCRFFSRDDLPYAVELFSDEFFAAWREDGEVSDVFGRTIRLGGPVSFVYIDGNHTYEYAKRDFEHADEFLERGGFILFDDSADGSKWEVCEVVKEVEALGRYELVSKEPNYFFMKK